MDFEDVKTMMKDSGMALMGYGTGKGKNRIEDAVNEAFKSPLLNDYDLKTAKNVLVNITGGKNEKGLTMDDMSEINRRIDEFTGNANNFKRGLIWDEDPEIGDTIHITSIVTGLKFTDVIGQTRNMGDHIMINRDFVYEKTAPVVGDNPSIVEGNVIGYSSKENIRKFNFNPDDRPSLLVAQGEKLAELENTPAIRRKKR